MSQIHQELKKLTAAPRVSTPPYRPQPQLPTPSFQRSETQATASAEEITAFQPSRPINRNLRPEFQQPPLNVRRQPPLCWECGLPGHISRFCPKRNSTSTNPPPGLPHGTDLARKGSGHEQEKANVYVNLTLLGKDVSCLLDSGCDLTLVPKDLIRSYRHVHVKPTRQQLYAANSTPIAIGRASCRERV